MDLADAFQIIIELARQNVADEYDNPDHHREQDEAISIVEDFATRAIAQTRKESEK